MNIEPADRAPFKGYDVMLAEIQKFPFMTVRIIFKYLLNICRCSETNCGLWMTGFFTCVISI